MKRYISVTAVLAVLLVTQPASAGQKAQSSGNTSVNSAHWKVNSDLALNAAGSYEIPRGSFKTKSGNVPDAAFFEVRNIGTVSLNGFDVDITINGPFVALTLQSCRVQWTQVTQGNDTCSDGLVSLGTTTSTNGRLRLSLPVNQALSIQQPLYMRATVPRNTNRNFSLQLQVSRQNIRASIVTNS